MAGISSKAAGTLTNRYKFNGGNELQNQEFSDGSGLELYDAMHRMYDPQLGRFFQIDELAEGNWEMTPYNFASDNPISRNDPLGLIDNNPDKPVYTPGTNMQGVTVVGKMKKLSHEQVQDFYYRLQNAGIGIDKVKSSTYRSQLEHYDGIAKYSTKLHAGVQEDGYMILEAASWMLPVGQITKLRYLGFAVKLMKNKFGRTAVKFGVNVVSESAKELIAQRFNGKAMDIHDIFTNAAVNTATESPLAKAGVMIWNSFNDFTIDKGLQTGFDINKSSIYYKEGSEIGLDLIFGSIKGATGIKFTESVQTGAELELDQLKATIGNEIRK